MDFIEALQKTFDGNVPDDGDLVSLSAVELRILHECRDTCRKRSLNIGDLLNGHREVCKSPFCHHNREVLLSDLQDIARVESGKSLDLTIEQVNIKEIILDCMEHFHALVNRKSIRMTASLESQPMKVYGDFKRLSQAFLNILCNAVNFVPKGGVIEVLAKGFPQEVIVSVIDNGIGISRSRLAHIFERFRDAEEHPEIEGRGFGIGLNLVRHLVSAHTGKVWVESAEKQGSNFSVCIPRQMLCEMTRPSNIKPLFG